MDSWGTASARALSGISWTNGGSRCANPAKIHSARNLPKTSARRFSTPSSSATIPRLRRSCKAPSRTLRRNSPTSRAASSRPRPWEKTGRIVVGGGFRDSRLGELAIALADIILKAEDYKIEMVPIRYHPDDAGLIGALHLAPSWIFEGHDSILAVDIGGTDIRCGVVETRSKKTPDLSKASVWQSELWRHADDEPSREEAVKRLIKMLKGLIAKAEKEGYKLAAFIGIACPGSSRATARSRRARRTRRATGRAASSICRQVSSKESPRSASTTRPLSCTTTASCRGLSEVPFMQDVKRWAS